MIHPITVKLLSKSRECNRTRQRQARQLQDSFSAPGSTSPSQVQRGMEILEMLLAHAGRSLREAKIALLILVREGSNGPRMMEQNTLEQAHR